MQRMRNENLSITIHGICGVRGEILGKRSERNIYPQIHKKEAEEPSRLQRIQASWLGNGSLLHQ